MTETGPDKHYEERFEYPLWKMIRQRAEEKDISYNAAYQEILPEYLKLIKYGDTEWVDAQIKKYNQETAMLKERESQRKTEGG